jgi:hypothetical protein
LSVQSTLPFQKNLRSKAMRLFALAALHLTWLRTAGRAA